MQWKATIGVGALGLLMSCATHGLPPAMDVRESANESVEASGDITRFLRPGHTLRLSRWADLDGDGDTDVVAVASPASTFAHRTLLILRREPDGALERVVENPRAVPPTSAGGMLGDPLQDLEAQRSGFTLRLEGGSRELWSRSLRFEFSSAADTWLLKTVTEKVLDRHDGVATEIRQDAKDFGTVRADEFDIEEIL